MKISLFVNAFIILYAVGLQSITLPVVLQMIGLTLLLHYMLAGLEAFTVENPTCGCNQPGKLPCKKHSAPLTGLLSDNWSYGNNQGNGNGSGLALAGPGAPPFGIESQFVGNNMYTRDFI